jgi:hypothetical protein
MQVSIPTLVIYPSVSSDNIFDAMVRFVTIAILVREYIVKMS